MVKFKILNVMRKSTAELLLRASRELTWGAALVAYIFEAQESRNAGPSLGAIF